MTWVTAIECIRRPSSAGTPLNAAEEPYAIIPLHGKYGQGKVAKVSLCDVAKVKRYRWYGDHEGYVIMYEPLKYPKRSFRVIKLHRLLLGMVCNDGRLADHRFGDRLDNRRTMIRECTVRQNGSSKRLQKVKLTASLKGVSFSQGAWRANIKADGTGYALGSYDSELEAALAYDKAARFHFGEFAFTNFPGIEAESADSILAKRVEERRVTHGSAYIGVVPKYVSVKSGKTAWRVRIGTERDRLHLGMYWNEEEAARIYDAAARFLYGPDAETNFAGSEAKSPDAIIDAYRKASRASLYMGVGKQRGYWRAKIKPSADSQEYWLGYYRVEEDAAKAYDAAVRYFRGPSARTNFPGDEALHPEKIAARREALPPHPRQASQFYGVSWHKGSERWHAILKLKYLGSSLSEEGAARMVDAALEARGQSRRNFP